MTNGYSSTEMVDWYRGLMVKIPPDRTKLGISDKVGTRYITEEELKSLFTGKFYVQERFEGMLCATKPILIRGRQHFLLYYDMKDYDDENNYGITYHRILSNNRITVEKIRVSSNNVRRFIEFAGKKVGTASSVTYYASEYSGETPSIEEIYELLDKYLREPSLYGADKKSGTIIKNYGYAGRYLFGEFLNPDIYAEWIIRTINKGESVSCPIYSGKDLLIYANVIENVMHL